MWACQARENQRRLPTTAKIFSTEEAKANHRKIAKYLLDAGADVNSEADVCIASYFTDAVAYYCCCLFVFQEWVDSSQASQDGHIELVKLLMTKEDLDVDHASKVSLRSP